MAHDVVILLIDLAVIIAGARLFGYTATRLGQPRVIGEILAGLLLGPTLLGTVISDRMFPESAREALSALATIGLVLFVFLVGYELEQKVLRDSGRTSLVVAVGALFVPAGLGTGLGFWLAERQGITPALPFAMFIGVAMAITAFPVLARIIAERGLEKTLMGSLALASAAIDDILAWILLAGVVIYAGVSQDENLWRLALAPPYVLAMFFVVRPLLRRLVEWRSATRRLEPGLLTMVMIGLLLSCAAAEYVGAHYIIGAFIFGAVMPRVGFERLRHDFTDKISWVNNVLFVPVFFAVAGLNVDLSKMALATVFELLVIVAVAVFSKLAGVYPAARLGGMGGRDALTLSTLMNTRGLTEIVVLTIGLQVGLVGQVMYSTMVAMALITTAMAGPLLAMLLRTPTPATTVADLPTPQPVPVGATEGGSAPAAGGDDEGGEVVPITPPSRPGTLARPPESDSARQDAA
jgi:Kef-type K+ transport system membrane component KefB